MIKNKGGNMIEAPKYINVFIAKMLKYMTNYINPIL